MIKGKTYTIASIDIYVFESLNNQNNADTDRKINVLYYHDPSSLFVVQQMRNIFKANDILENFIFEEIFNPEELEGKLLMGSYDIYIGSINLGIKKDVLALFGTEDPLLNPSRYRNPILSSLIKQYTKSPDQNVAGEITVLLGQDMPLLLLGYTYFPLQIKNNILQSVFYEAQDVSVREWRHKIYSEHALVHNIRVDLGNALSRNNFVSFIHGNISSRQSWLSQRRALFQTTTSQGHSDGIILEDGTRELPTPITIFEGLVTSADTE